MKKFNTAQRTQNAPLGIVYFSLSMISWFVLPMALEGTMNAINPLIIRLSDICEIVLLVIPPLCIAAMVAASVLQKKGFGQSAAVVRIIPLVVFALDLLLLIGLII